MPSSNPLSFLRPLYDIAVWQFILMSGYKAISGRESPRNTHIKFTWKMHEVVANFLCKLLEVRAFDHLQSQLLGEEVKSATGNWEVGQIATTKLVEWCQDQWRRKDPRLPGSNAAYSENEPLTIPWFDNIPVCHRCGVPCPSCRNELASELPSEMSTARLFWTLMTSARTTKSRVMMRMLTRTMTNVVMSKVVTHPRNPNTALQVLRCECSWDQGKGSIMPPTKLVQTFLVIFRWKHVQTLFLR